MASSGCPHESLLERICFSSRWSFATQIDYNCLESQSSRGRVAQLGEHLLCKRKTKFAKTCRSRRNPLKSSKLKQNPASRFSPFCSLSIRNLPRFVATCTTFLLRWGSSVVHGGGTVRNRTEWMSLPSATAFVAVQSKGASPKHAIG